jgi:catalase
MCSVIHPRAHSRNPSTWAALAETLAHHVTREHPPDTITKEKPALRDAHPKHHGCVRAEVEVPCDIPAELARGVFQRGARYQALIRFSNALKVRHDLDRDARGMAIKLLDVPGERVRLLEIHGKQPKLMDEGVPTQDFLLVTHSEFFTATAPDFLEVANAIIAAGSSQVALGFHIGRCFFGLNPPRFRVRAAWALFRTLTWTSNPLFLRYFSQTPFRYSQEVGEPGDEDAAKFRVRPKQHVSVKGLLKFWWALATYWAAFGKTHRRRDMLKDLLHDYLAERTATFDLEVQLRTHPKCMPLDDATRRWPVWRSPYRRVATIRIAEDQRYRDPQFVKQGLELGERLTFSPWHAVEAHRPLGSLNRARLFAYARVSTLRNGLNGTDAKVPPQARGVLAPDDCLDAGSLEMGV